MFALCIVQTNLYLTIRSILYLTRMLKIFTLDIVVCPDALLEDAPRRHVKDCMVKPLAVNVGNQALHRLGVCFPLQMFKRRWDVSGWQERKSHQLSYVVIDSFTLLVCC